MINFARWLRSLFRRGRYYRRGLGSIDLRGKGNGRRPGKRRSAHELRDPPIGGASGLPAEEVSVLAAKLREVCALMLAEGEPGPVGSERSAFLVGWCLRMLA